MARGNQLVQSPGDRHCPNAYRPVPSASSAGASLEKSLFPCHSDHSRASSEDGVDSSPGAQGHQHGRGGLVPIRPENVAPTPDNQIPLQVGVQPSGAATRTCPNPYYHPRPTSSSVQGTESVVPAEALNTVDPINIHHPNLNSNIHASSDNLDSADSLDPLELYKIGQLLCSIARDMIAENVRPAQIYILDWFPVPPDVPIPFSTSFLQQYRHTPATHHSSTPVVQLNPQSHPRLSDLGGASVNAALPIAASPNQLPPGPSIHLSPSFGFEGTRIDSNDHDHLPDHLSSGPSDPNAHSVGVAASNSHGDETFDQNFPVLQPISPGSEAPTSPDPNPRVCTRCNKRFNRTNDLLDHMHKHDGIKRHSCRFCGVLIAYRNNLIEHQKKCKHNPDL
ncbi:unnamed protein product [Rhizoctonia solani]|uniref:C2H2-type domain-containing protein n=1 Tax=Rhizoctonia solani TaxID=456999 RepID=A0A8H3H0C8_9AGAM|nr:unnamed protein product [Rhizoctonia solani]